MKSCLIVDDSKVVRMVARKILEGLRFDIDEAEDGQKAIEACQRHMPDAVLLDWNMPVKNGLEFLQELRAMQNGNQPRSEEHTSELQSLVRISYAAFCLTKHNHIHY